MWDSTTTESIFTSPNPSTEEYDQYKYEYEYEYEYEYDKYKDYSYEDYWHLEVWINSNRVQKLLKSCSDGLMVWLVLKIFILVTSLLANSALLWLLFKSRHNLNPSQLLALNMSVMNILSCLSAPFYYLMDSFSAFDMFGCPLFLTLMCLERYVAAAFPLTYLRLGKRKHRIVLSALSWIATTCVSVVLYFFESFVTVLALAVIISVFFLIMLLCLAGIVYVLCQSRPGDGADSSSDSLKKRALCNIIMVMVPSAVAYCPLVVVVRYLAIIMYNDISDQCTVLHFLLFCPNIGLFIGPLFYWSQIRQMTCCKKETNTSAPTQEV